MPEQIQGYNNDAIVLPQVTGALAFLLSLASTLSCDFIVNNLEYGFEADMEENIGFGMFCRHTSALLDEQTTVTFRLGDFQTLFFGNLLFYGVSIVCNALATLLGLTVFTWSLFLLCQNEHGYQCMTKGLAVLSISCALLAGASNLIFFSDICSIDVCDVVPDQTIETYCIQSYCTVGKGFYFAVAACILWIFSSIMFLRLRKRRIAEQYQSPGLRDGKKVVVNVAPKQSKLPISKRKGKKVVVKVSIKSKNRNCEEENGELLEKGQHDVESLEKTLSFDSTLGDVFPSNLKLEVESSDLRDGSNKSPMFYSHNAEELGEETPIDGGNSVEESRVEEERIMMLYHKNRTQRNRYNDGKKIKE